MSEYSCISNCCHYKMEEYKQTQQQKYYIRGVLKAGIILYTKDKKVLLVQSRGRLWGFPKGKANEFEEPKDCAVREVFEETGLTINKDLLTKSINIHKNVYYFLLEIEECNLEIQHNLIGNDANGIGWFNIDCLLRGGIELNQHCKVILGSITFYCGLSGGGEMLA